MTTICIIRHGATDWNAAGKMQGQTDIPLNPTGIKQAEACRKVLKNEQWDLIVTSPLQRAKRTGEIINEGIDAPLIVLDEFIERSFGDAEGMTSEERERHFPEGHYPNQEERETVYERVRAGLAKIHEKVPNGKVILVSHGAAINSILAIFSDGKVGSGKTKLIHGGMSQIQFQGDQWLILNYNQADHLSANKGM